MQHTSESVPGLMPAGFRLILSGVLFVLVGCASLSKEDCATADWRQVGYDDGYAGRPAEHYLEYRRDCLDYGIKPDVEAYKVGRNEALRNEYCTKARGYSEGMKGRGYHDVCVGVLEWRFMKGYLQGRNAYKGRRYVKDSKHQFDGLFTEPIQGQN